MFENTMYAAANIRYSQEAEVIPIPINAKKPKKYIGCLEMRYTPFVTGLSFGVVAKLCTPNRPIIIQTK